MRINLEFDAVLSDHRSVHGYSFSSSNKQLTKLFVNTGIWSLRIGGDTIDIFLEAVYNSAWIDRLFGSARAVGTGIIYSLDDMVAPKWLTDKYRYICF